MFAPQERDQLRRTFIDAWRKRSLKETPSDLERMIIDVCLLHPEYHDLLEDADTALSAEFPPESGQTNPFLHMGMHIAIQEQLSIDRPLGIRSAYLALRLRLGDDHSAAHEIMECLGAAMWEAQSQQRPPDEKAYIECLKKRG